MKPVLRILSIIFIALIVNQLSASTRFSKTDSIRADKYYRIADSIYNTGELEDANKLYKEALRFKEVLYRSTYGDKHPYLADCLIDYGNFYFRKNNVDKALRMYQKALIANIADFNDKSIYSNPSINATHFRDIFSHSLSDDVLLKLFMQRAKAFRKRYDKSKDNEDLKMSLSSVEFLLQIIIKLRSGYFSEESKDFVAENQSDIYNLAINTAYLLYANTGDANFAKKAFGFSGNSKAEVLTAELRTDKNNAIGNVPDDFKATGIDLEENISLLEEKLLNARCNNNADPDKVSNWENKLSELNRKYDTWISEVEDQYFNYYNLKFSCAKRTIDDINTRLTEGENILEYTITDTLVYIFIISHNDFEFIARDIDESFHKSKEIILNYPKISRDGNESFLDYQQWKTASFELYSKLIRPTKKLLKGNKLIIIPDCNLSLISFEALIKEEDNSQEIDYSSLPYLLYDYDIRYFCPTFFQETQQKVRKRNTRAFVFSTNRGQNRKEIASLRKCFPSHYYTNKKASETVFKWLNSANSILYLSLSANTNCDNPMYSNLTFNSDKDTVNDGRLFAYEILNMKIDAYLVILRTKNISLVASNHSKGIMNLVRAFFHAECRSVMLSFWELDDYSNAEPMVSFYNYLSKGITKTSALKQAKIDYINNSEPRFCNPIYWSGVVIFGDDSPIVDVKDFFIIFVIVGILILIIWGLHIFKNSKVS